MHLSSTSRALRRICVSRRWPLSSNCLASRRIELFRGRDGPAPRPPKTAGRGARCHDWRYWCPLWGGGGPPANFRPSRSDRRSGRVPQTSLGSNTLNLALQRIHLRFRRAVEGGGPCDPHVGNSWRTKQQTHMRRARDPSRPLPLSARVSTCKKTLLTPGGARYLPPR
jgi:hypothetical protein